MLALASVRTALQLGFQNVSRAALLKAAGMSCSAAEELAQCNPSERGRSAIEMPTDGAHLGDATDSVSVPTLDRISENEMHQLLQKGVRLFSVPFSEKVPRIRIKQQEAEADGGVASQYTAIVEPCHLQWVPSTDRPLQTRAHTSAVVQASASSQQEAKAAVNRAILTQWVDAGLLVHDRDGFRFNGQSPYISLAGATAASHRVHVPSFISKQDMLQLPLRKFHGQPHLIQDAEEAQAVVQSILNQARNSDDPGDRVVGFDIEWRPSFRPGTSNPPALVQVASRTDVHVMQLTAFTSRREPTSRRAHAKETLQWLKPLLEDPSVQKCGVGVLGDVAMLQRWDASIEARGIVDLQPLANELQFRVSSLGGLCCLVLGFRISKAQRMSNWELPRLTPAQISYAATDAWVSREVAVKLLNSR